MKAPGQLAALERPVQYRVELLLGEVVPVALPRRPTVPWAADDPVRSARVRRQGRARGPHPTERDLPGGEGGQRLGVEGQWEAREGIGGQRGRLAQESGDPAKGERRQR